MPEHQNPRRPVPNVEPLWRDAVGGALDLTLLDLTVAVARDLHTSAARAPRPTRAMLSLAA